MNILITGATGFIGRHLVEKLGSSGEHTIFCLVRNRHKAKQLERFKVKFIYADITAKSSLDKILNYKIDTVFHCAGFVKNSPLETLHKVNVLGTENICELSLRLGIKKLVYLSSVAVVSGNPQIPLVENLPFSATNIYGQSKIKAEKVTLKYREKGLPTVIIRPCIVYGEDEPHVMRPLLSLLKYRFLPLLDEGRGKFHLVYVKNVVELLIYSLTNDEFLKGSFFIADKEVFTTKEVFRILSQAIGAKPPFNIPSFLKPLLLKIPFAGKKIGFFLKDRVYSIERIKSLGFIPPYPARESLAKSAQHILNR